MNSKREQGLVLPNLIQDPNPVYHFAIPHAPPKPKVLPPHPDTAPPKPTLRCTNHPLPDIYPPLSSAHTSYVLTCAIKPSHRHGLDLRDSRVRAVVAPPPVHLATAVAIAATAATPCTTRRATQHSVTSLPAHSDGWCLL